MKKYLLFALMLLSALPLRAQFAAVRPKHHDAPQQSAITLTISAPRGLRFWLFVDDVPQNQEPVQSICIRNLWDDDFYVRVELENPQQNCMGQFVDLSHPQTLSIAQSGQFYGLVFSQAYVSPELTIDLVLPKENIMPDMPQMPNTPPMFNGMPPQDFEEAYQLIKKESFDSSRLTLAKQVVTSNPMNTNQILDICKLFDFESNKLEFAKFAYLRCTDKNKYYLLNEAFSFDSSKRELDEYIQGIH